MSLLKNIAKQLREGNLSTDEAVELASASIDKQVKKYLINYLKNASQSQLEGNSHRDMTMFFLTEADEEDKDEKKKSSKNDKSTQSQKKTLEQLDINSFTSDVVRLIENFNSLIEIRDSVVIQAKNFLKNEYDDQTVKVFVNLLSDEYDITIGKSKWDNEIMNVQPPPAKGAGPSEI